MAHKILIKNIENVTHNVLRIVTEKPSNYTFIPGQATELAIDKDGFREEKRPFTFTSLPDDDELEFTIKQYYSHDGVTKELGTLKVGDHLLIGEAWGAINYKGAGTFIAGGAGITPFIAILKDLNDKGELANDYLHFGNKSSDDIIYKNNLDAWLGNNVDYVLSDENVDGMASGHIDIDYLKEKGLDTSKYVYLCGPPPMMEAVTASLTELGLPQSLLITEE